MTNYKVSVKDAQQLFRLLWEPQPLRSTHDLQAILHGGREVCVRPRAGLLGVLVSTKDSEYFVFIPHSLHPSLPLSLSLSLCWRWQQ